LVRYPPGEALLALYRRRGAFINSGIGRHGYTYLLGGEANKFVSPMPTRSAGRKRLRTWRSWTGPRR
jgi:hypothetical protein